MVKDMNTNNEVYILQWEGKDTLVMLKTESNDLVVLYDMDKGEFFKIPSVQFKTMRSGKIFRNEYNRFLYPDEWKQESFIWERAYNAINEDSDNG